MTEDGSTTIRISARAHAVLRDLADGEQRSLRQVLEHALGNYQRQRFLAVANRQYAALRDDPEAWAHEQAERDAWDPRPVVDTL